MGSHSKKPAIPWLPVVITLAACGLLALILTPSRTQVIVRHERDGNVTRALDLIDSLPASRNGAATDPSALPATRIRLERKRLTYEKRHDQAPQVLALGLRTYRDHPTPDVLEEIQTLIQLTEDPKQAHHLVRVQTQGLPGSITSPLFRAVAEHALAQGDPETAATVFEQEVVSLSWKPEDLQELVRLWRSAGKSALALKAIESFQQQAGAPDASSIDPEAQAAIHVLKIQLLRELSRPEEAFAESLEAFDEGFQIAEDYAPEQETLESLLETTALETGNEIRLMPFYKRRVSNDPNDLALKTRLGELYVGSQRLDEAEPIYRDLVTAQPDDPALQKRYAQILLWNGKADEAFDRFQPLALKGDRESLDILLQLYAGLYREAGMAAILEKILATVDAGWAAGYAPQHAQLLAQLGRYDEALSAYRRLLQARSEPLDPSEQAEARSTLANLLFELYRYPEAAAHYEALSATPVHAAEAALQLARCLVHQGRYREAADHYHRLVTRTRFSDEAAVTEFKRLTEALGDYDRFADLLSNEMMVRDDSPPEAYLDAARGLFRVQRTDMATEVLSHAFARYSDHDEIRYLYSLSLSWDQQLVEARRVLADHPKLGSARDATLHYLSILTALGDWEAVVRFAESRLSDSLATIPEIQQELGEAFNATAAFDRALAIFEPLYQADPSQPGHALSYAATLIGLGRTQNAQSVMAPFLESSDPEILSMAAQVAAAAGEMAAAEKLQQRFLVAAPTTTHYDWGFLGDIRLELGDREQAKRDYEKALGRLLDNTRRRLQLARQ